MTTLVAGEEPAVRLDEVLLDDQSYSPEAVESLLGISAGAILRADQAGAFHDRYGSAASFAIGGASLRRWIEREHIDFAVTARARSLVLTRRASDRVPVSAPRVPTTAETAVELLRDEEQKRAAAEARRQASYLDVYVSLLGRETSSPRDAETLRDMARELGREPKQILYDDEHVRQIRKMILRLQHAHNQRQQQQWLDRLAEKRLAFPDFFAPGPDMRLRGNA